MLLRIARRTSAVAAAIAVTAALEARAHAQAVQPTDQPAFGLVGIARGQTARLNVSIGAI